MQQSKKDSNVKMTCQIDRQLLPIKGFYFCILGATGSLLTYLPVFAFSLGFTAYETGIIFGTLPFVAFFVRPLWGVLADKTNRYKVLLFSLAILSAVFHLALLYIPKTKSGPPVLHVNLTMTCQSHVPIIEDCSLMGCMAYNSSQHLNCTLTCHNMTYVSGLYEVTKYSSVHGNKTPMYSDNLSQSDCPELSVRDYRVNSGSVSQRDMCFTGRELYACTGQCLQCAREDNSKKSFSLQFWMFFIVSIAATVVYCSLSTINDALAYHILGPSRANQWGRQRLWGTLGFATMALVAGFSMDMFSAENVDSDYSIAFYIFVGCCVVSAIISCFMRIEGNIHCSNMSSHFITLFKQAEFTVVLVLVFIMGLYFGVIVTFLFKYLTELDKKVQLLMGLCLVANCLLEVPAMYFTGHLINKISEIKCLYIVYLFFAARFIGLSFLHNPWFALPLEFLHGLSFGLLWPAMTHYVSRIAPPGMCATMQGLLSGVHFGIGMGAGSLLGGVIYETYGARKLFLGCGISAGAMLLPTLLTDLFLFKRAHSIELSVPAKDHREQDGNEDDVTNKMMCDITDVSHPGDKCHETDHMMTHRDVDITEKV